jgi:hypothetical protein
LCCGLAACGGTLPTVTNVDVAIARQRWPGTTIETLNEGRTLYLRRCGTCHALYEPAERNELAWRESLLEMRERARLVPRQEDSILRYLVAVGSPRPLVDH